MMLKTERFTEGYLPFEPANMLPAGWIVAGKNVSKYGQAGAWKSRPGYTLINTTAAGAAIKSVIQYTNPKQGDYHLLSQLSGDLRDNTLVGEELITLGGEALVTLDGDGIIAGSVGNPLEQAIVLGSTMFTDISATPAFTAVVGEDLVLADNNGAPIVFGGNNPFPEAVLVDTGSGVLIDVTKKMTDQDSTTYTTIPAAAGSKYYVGMKGQGSGVKLQFGTNLNTNAVTLVVKAWRSGAWAAVSDLSDGTAGTQMHDRAGTINWSVSVLDEMRVLGNRQLFWYEFSFSGAPTAIDLTQVQAIRAMQRMVNKWDGSFRYLTGAMFYDHSEGQYQDKLGMVSNVSEEQFMSLHTMQTDDFIYIKTPEKALGFGFGIVTGAENAANSQVDLVEGWSGADWLSISALVDTTLDVAADSSFAQAGMIWIDQASYSLEKRTLGGDGVPGFWYRVSIDAIHTAEVKLSFIVYATAPDTMPYAAGVVEFNGRAIYWGNKSYPNRLIYSPYNRPDQLCDIEERLTYPFGGEDAIKAVGVLGSYLLVLKARGIYLMGGDFGTPLQLSSVVGIASPKSLAIAELGDRTLKSEERIPVAMWQDLDGIYMVSVGGNITKVSDGVRDYFDPTRASYIGESHVTDRQGYISPIDSTYRLILPDREIIYSVRDAGWWPYWERALVLSTATVIKGTDNRYSLVGGTTGGHLVLLESGVNDYDTNNIAVAIEASVKSRLIYIADGEANAITGYLRQLWLELWGEDMSHGPEFGAMPLDFSGGALIGLVANLYLNRSTIATALPVEVTDPNLDLLMTKGAIGHDAIYCFQLEMIAEAVGQSVIFTSFSYFLKYAGTYGG